jgi:hypothetical protein
MIITAGIATKQADGVEIIHPSFLGATTTD